MIRFIKNYQDVDHFFPNGAVAGFKQSKEQRLVQQGYAIPAPEGARALKVPPGKAVVVECVTTQEEMEAAPKGAILKEEKAVLKAYKPDLHTR